MANKINFITGETYTLAELFSGERRIIIPDLQRDYCWGDENNVKSTGETGELVSDFIKNLIEQYEKEKDGEGSLNLGLFYGYEVPANHIQLCDGQQRLTTLYLLLGMLNKKTGKIRHHLISDYQYKQDDKEPYLNYAIRESSLYFLRDLVCQFFIGNQDKVETIKKADWYFEDYNLDPSIQSILNALKKIEDLSKALPEDLGKFEDWILNKITFLYFDMETRKDGEETFVVINTTGEALSATQNLKPLVLQEKNNRFDNTSATVTLTALYDMTFIFQYSVSTESNYDMLRVVCDGVEVVYAGGSLTDVYSPTLTVAAGGTLQITYSKDGSVTYGTDTVTVKDFIYLQEEQSADDEGNGEMTESGGENA